MNYKDHMYSESIAQYEQLRGKYQEKIIAPMKQQEYFDYSEILFSTHSCAIEGNSFSVNDTRELKEKGLGMIPRNKSLLEAFEILDHFCAFEYMMQQAAAGTALDEKLLKEINRLCTLHTLNYHAADAVPGEYTTCDMAAGDTLFGNHQELIARVPELLRSTEKALQEADSTVTNRHPMVIAARFHGFYEYLHPFRDGNGRTGRLVSNYILQRAGHPLVVIPKERKEEYITALRQIRQEGTDEHLVHFFLDCAIQGMQQALKQKAANTNSFRTFIF